MINDINGFRAEGAIDAVKDRPVRDAHARPAPDHAARTPYDDVVAEVEQFLQTQVDLMKAAGIGRERICIDPGFGFGKTVEHNLALLRNTRRLIDRWTCRCWQACRASP
jgi:dihydropteroate synthase